MVLEVQDPRAASGEGLFAVFSKAKKANGGGGGGREMKAVELPPVITYSILLSTRAEST